jgi:hypothetical protein
MVSAVIRRNKATIWPPAWSVELLGSSSKGFHLPEARYRPSLAYLHRESRSRSPSGSTVAPATGSRRTARSKKRYRRYVFLGPFVATGGQVFEGSLEFIISESCGRQ